MFLIGHLALAWPVARLFPDSLLALQVFTTRGRHRRCPRRLPGAAPVPLGRRATVAVVVMMAGPIWSPLAGSFMTDVPAAAAQCRLPGPGRAWPCGRPRGAPRPSPWSARCVVGLVGATIREYAIVAPIVVVVIVAVRAAARRERRDLVVSLVLGGVAAGVYAGAFLARRTMPGSLSLTPTVPPSPGSAFGRSALFTVVTAAFLILPVFAWVRWRSLATIVTARRWATVAVGCGARDRGWPGSIRVWTWSPAAARPLPRPARRARRRHPARPVAPAAAARRWCCAGCWWSPSSPPSRSSWSLCSTGATLLLAHAGHRRPGGDRRSPPSTSGPDPGVRDRLGGRVWWRSAPATSPCSTATSLGLVPFAAGLVLAHRTTSRRATGSGGPSVATGDQARRVVEVAAVVVVRPAGPVVGRRLGRLRRRPMAGRRAGRGPRLPGRPGRRRLRVAQRAPRRRCHAHGTGEHDADGVRPGRVRRGPGAASRRPAPSVLFTVDLGQPFRQLGPAPGRQPRAPGCRLPLDPGPLRTGACAPTARLAARRIRPPGARSRRGRRPGCPSSPGRPARCRPRPPSRPSCRRSRRACPGQVLLEGGQVVGLLAEPVLGLLDPPVGRRWSAPAGDDAPRTSPAMPRTERSTAEQVAQHRAGRADELVRLGRAGRASSPSRPDPRRWRCSPGGGPSSWSARRGSWPPRRRPPRRRPPGSEPRTPRRVSPGREASFNSALRSTSVVWPARRWATTLAFSAVNHAFLLEVDVGQHVARAGGGDRRRSRAGRGRRGAAPRGRTGRRPARARPPTGDPPRGRPWSRRSASTR